MKVKLKSRKRTYSEELTYRSPMSVKFAVIDAHDNSYPLCPKCGGTIGREYQLFCDKCGQKFNWDDFDNVQYKYLVPRALR